MSELNYIEIPGTEWEKLDFGCECGDGFPEKQCDFCNAEELKLVKLDIYKEYHYTCGPDGRMREGTILKAVIEESFYKKLLGRLFLKKSS